ncbi:MAG TPA: hypothetical protein VNZ45_15260, partial [Bacteroidia bacterium]|nr:hypothetical protein [Bacteroidia bacterium]
LTAKDAKNTATQRPQREDTSDAELVSASHTFDYYQSIFSLLFLHQNNKQITMKLTINALRDALFLLLVYC